jgi:hypothetical protein
MSFSFEMCNIFKEGLFFVRGDDSKGNQIGFASQLDLLVDALDMSFEAQFMEDFVSGLNPFFFFFGWLYHNHYLTILDAL